MNKPATLQKTWCFQKRRHILSPSLCDHSKRPRQYLFSISASTYGLTKSLAWDELETVFRVGSSFHCSYLKCMRGMFHAKTNLKLGNCSSRIFRLFTILSQQTGELIRLHTVCCQRQVTSHTAYYILQKFWIMKYQLFNNRLTMVVCSITFLYSAPKYKM